MNGSAAAGQPAPPAAQHTDPFADDEVLADAVGALLARYPQLGELLEGLRDLEDAPVSEQRDRIAAADEALRAVLDGSSALPVD